MGFRSSFGRLTHIPAAGSTADGVDFKDKFVDNWSETIRQIWRLTAAAKLSRLNLLILITSLNDLRIAASKLQNCYAISSIAITTKATACGYPTITERLIALGPLINEICTISGVPGLSLGVSYKGETIHRVNYGYKDVEKQQPPDSDTAYGIGSITKCFTATAISQLIGDNKLEFSTSIKDILPDFESSDATVTQQTTVIDLLTHRVGLATSNSWWYGAEGDLLLKNQTISTFGDLKPTGSFRAQFDYSNCGLSYEDYLQKSIFGPLELTRTTAAHDCISSDSIAKPYTVLDDGSFHLLPRPQAQDGTIMGPAQGILSTVNDLLKYSNSLLQALSDEKASPLKNVKSQLSGHIFTSKSILESSYALGFFRHQLPGAITGTGINGAFVKNLPVITPRGDARLVISHFGSLAEYTSFLAFLPEIDSSLVVLTNSIGWADPSAWIGHIIVEALVDTPNPVDILKYVKEAAENHKNSYPKLQKTFDEARSNDTKSSPAEEYVAFQGLDSQVWDLTHYENDTFHRLSSRDEQAKRARFTYPFSPGLFKIIFNRNSEGHVDSLCWPQDASIPADEQCFSKVEMADGNYGVQKIVQAGGSFEASFKVMF
ncbi:hypothetical protein V502_00832 [Pseudogymnoascus sp. VKM F-4520 (FW-2644)]|nr:hypothetical protein V502_00832 [Pseudogymnoascus sp. VKM F-4520 (FW-2644)]